MIYHELEYKEKIQLNLFMCEWFRTGKCSLELAPEVFVESKKKSGYPISIETLLELVLDQEEWFRIDWRKGSKDVRVYDLNYTVQKDGDRLEIDVSYYRGIENHINQDPEEKSALKIIQSKPMEAPYTS